MKSLTKVILENGKENIYFLAKVRPLHKVMFVSYTSSNDPEIEMLCKINTDRYKVEDGYKVTLEPIYKGFAKEDYYVSDLENIIEGGQIKLLVNQSV